MKILKISWEKIECGNVSTIQTNIETYINIYTWQSDRNSFYTGIHTVTERTAVDWQPLYWQPTQLQTDSPAHALTADTAANWQPTKPRTDSPQSRGLTALTAADWQPSQPQTDSPHTATDWQPSPCTDSSHTATDWQPRSCTNSPGYKSPISIGYHRKQSHFYYNY